MVHFSECLVYTKFHGLGCFTRLFDTIADAPFHDFEALEEDFQEFGLIQRELGILGNEVVDK